ncbi:MAG: elongation factor G [Candidatus Cloacimonadota bacterium]|nr:MAG: elongation factor G [Candidatus Cloacimonadota bacterium]
MKKYDMKNIRNIAFLGSSGAGKTTLIEQMLFNSKMTTRLGKIEDSNTVTDFDADEIEKKMSIAMGIAHADLKDVRFNFIDTPGYSDYIGECISAVTAVETVAVVANASAGYEVGLERSFEIIADKKNTAAIIVNRMDNDQADYKKVLDLIQENAEITPAPILIPIGSESKFEGVADVVKNKAFIGGKVVDIPSNIADEVEEYRMKLTEAVAETDEVLLDKYFEEGELTGEELIQGVKKGIVDGTVIPVFACSGGQNIGVDALLNAFVEYLPSPADKNVKEMVKGDEVEEIQLSADGNTIAYIFKSFSDPNIGDIAYCRVFSGILKSGSEYFIPEKDTKEKVGNMYYLQGKNRSDASGLRAGEIGGLVKLKHGRGFDTIVEQGETVKHPVVELPEPVVWSVIKGVSQSDDDKIGIVIQRLLDEDPTMHQEFNDETHQHVIAAVGEQQLNLILKRLKSRYKVNAVMENPIIPYKETITGRVEDQHYKHKKQSGGRGQFGDVYFKISPKPRGEGFEFVDSIVGGVIPSKFIPAIEKGCREKMEQGIIAGYPVVDIKVELYYGSYHDVDSSEMAFKIASSQCLKEGFAKCKPILLEPIHEVEIIIPNEYMGDVMGDVSTRRGKIIGMEQAGKKQNLKAHMPLAELFGYFVALKSLTQGRGIFKQKFDHYEKVPEEITQKVIAAYESEE